LRARKKRGKGSFLWPGFERKREGREYQKKAPQLKEEAAGVVLSAPSGRRTDRNHRSEGN